MSWEIIFYEMDDGEKPVYDFIDNLPTSEKAKIYKEIDLLEEHGIKIGLPRAKDIKGERYKKLWELRVRFNNVFFRIFYFLFTGKKFILLHVCKKKKRKTDKNDLEIARERMLNYQQRVGLK